MRRGEVHWVEFDPSVGQEIQKTRPAVVVSNDDANRVLRRFLVVPLTSNISRVYPGETLIYVNGEQGKAMADQLTTVSQLRVRNLLGRVSDEDMESIEAAVLLQLGLATGSLDE